VWCEGVVMMEIGEDGWFISKREEFGLLIKV
jgi:hypothetical protein